MRIFFFSKKKEKGKEVRKKGKKEEKEVIPSPIRLNPISASSKFQVPTLTLSETDLLKIEALLLPKRKKPTGFAFSRKTG